MDTHNPDFYSVSLARRLVYRVADFDSPYLKGYHYRFVIFLRFQVSNAT